MLHDAEYRSKHAAARVGMALFRMAQAIKKMMQMESDRAGLSPVQIQALLFARHTREDVATVGHFARTIGATHVTAVKVVNGLIRKGLIEKKPSPHDQRITLLRLTPKGQDRVLALENWGNALEQTLQRVPEEVLNHLEIGLGAILSSLKQQGYLTISEPCRGCIHFRPNAGNGHEPHFCNMIQKFLTHESSLKECPEHTPFSSE